MTNSDSSLKCLVLVPQQEQHKRIYEEEIRPAIEAAGLEAQRIDDLESRDLLASSKWRAIKDAKLGFLDVFSGTLRRGC